MEYDFTPIPGAKHLDQIFAELSHRRALEALCAPLDERHQGVIDGNNPTLLARQWRAEREQRDAAAMKWWRTWLHRNLDQTIALSDAELQRRDDLIKWLFPLGGRSTAHPGAPMIGRHSLRQAVEADLGLQEALLKVWTRMLSLYGLEERDGAVRWRGAPLAWATKPGADDRRISRVLRCLKNAGLGKQAAALMAFLEVQFAGVPERAEALL